MTSRLKSGIVITGTFLLNRQPTDAHESHVWSRLQPNRFRIEVLLPAVRVLLYNAIPVPSRYRRELSKLRTHKPHLYTSVHKTALPPRAFLLLLSLQCVLLYDVL